MKIYESEHIWFNGRLVPWKEAQVHVLAHVIHYGSGVFEGIRAYASSQGPRILGLEPHVERFLSSCKVIGMELPYDAGRISEAIRETVRANGHEACYVRPFAFRGYGRIGIDPSKNPVEVAIATVEWGTLMGEGALENGVDVGVSSWRRMAPDTHPAMAKAAGNYLNSQLTLLEARRHGYAEAVVLDIDGYVCEGSGENIFLYYDGRLHTPPVGASILPGITRGYVLRLARELDMEIVEQRVPREMMYICDEMFMTGTAAEITPVRSVDGKPVGSGLRGPVTERLQREFFAILEGEVEDRHGWLTSVGKA